MTVIEIVRQAVRAVKGTDKEDVVTWLLVEGYDINPAGDIFRALETIAGGRDWDTNYRKVRRKDLSVYDNYKEHNKVAREKQSTYVKDRYHNLRAEGLCAICGKSKVLLDRALCRSCLDAQAKHKRRYPAVRYAK